MKLSFAAILTVVAAVVSALPVQDGFSARNELFGRSNDYPYSGKCNGNGGIDPWNYYRCMLFYVTMN